MGAISGIYMVINLDNGKYYIGSSKDVERRFHGHKRELNENTHNNIYLQRSWDKYGEDKFEFLVLEEVENEEKLLEKEQKYLDEIEPEYNIAKYADAPARGRERSKEAKQKISRAMSGKNNPMYQKSRENAPFYGEEHDQRTKKRISESHKGMTHTEKAKRKMSESSRAENLSDETRRKMSEAKKGEKAPKSKLNEKKVKVIKHLLKGGHFTNTEIGKMYDITQPTISSIKHRRTWTHVKLEE